MGSSKRRNRQLNNQAIQSHQMPSQQTSDPNLVRIYLKATQMIDTLPKSPHPLQDRRTPSGLNLK
jgi:hypothetical protein